MGWTIQSSNEKSETTATVFTHMAGPAGEDCHQPLPTATGTGDRYVNTEEPISPITLEELKITCSRLRNKKAPGSDGIPNIALKKAISIVPDMFLHMYNRCQQIQEGYFPAKWKIQRLVFLLKGNKPSDEPSAYRPLCILDSAG